MNLDDLWIGDQLRVKSTGMTGHFDGIDTRGCAVIKTETGEIHADPDDIELVEEEVQVTFPDLEKKGSGLDLSASADFPLFLDLHIEILAPEKAKLPAYSILDYQLRSCTSYLGQAIDFQKPWVDIIHGVGKGALRREVLDLLRGIEAVSHIDESESGKLRVYFTY